MTDQFIIQKIKRPETVEYGFNLLVRKYQERIYWHARKLVVDHDDANDLTQEIFVKIWKNIKAFREDSKIFTWIYRIATNECLNFLNKKKKKFFVPINDVSEELAKKLDTDFPMDGETIQIKLQKAILNLPEKQRVVFNLKYFDEMKFEEISEITGTSTGALKASYHHARKKIEKYLNND